MKRWLVMVGFVVVLIAVAGGLWGYNLSKKMAGFKSAGQPKQTITAMQVQPQQWRDEVHAMGSLRAVRGADLAPEVAGTVDQVNFESGTDVKAGVVLMQLRVDDERAKLDALKAAAELTESVYRRNRQQFDAKAISQAQLDSDATNVKSAKAQVAQQQALVDKKIIRAPFAGHLGIREVDEGQYIGAGTKVVTLQALDPIHIDFSLPQQELAVIRQGQAVTVRVDVFPDKTFSGRIVAIDPSVDVSTRTVKVRATLKNPERQLLPGMFARVDLETGDPHEYLTLPQTAITYNPYGESVFIVTTPDRLDGAAHDQVAAKAAQEKPAGSASTSDTQTQLVAKQVFVKIGPKRGDQVAILSGIEKDDQVVTSGQLKLKNGAPVIINNSVIPRNDPAPKPQEE